MIDQVEMEGASWHHGDICLLHLSCHPLMAYHGLLSLDGLDRRCLQPVVALW